jgi:tRNA pseudouridine38-40 synthase
MLKRYKLIVEYDGTHYAGWQYQDHVETIQKILEEALYKFSQQSIRLHVAGRTDAGVHALGQVAHFDLDTSTRLMEASQIAKAINAYLHDHPISVLSCQQVDEHFHARFSAIQKHYCYQILNRISPPALQRHYVWHIRQTLQEDAMKEAGQFLLGHHDFSAFRAKECQARSPFKTLDRIAWSREGAIIKIHFFGKSFLHHQVRNMVGTLVEVGLGKRHPTDIPVILASKMREQAGVTAPPQGLTLVNIDYENQIVDKTPCC